MNRYFRIVKGVGIMASSNGVMHTHERPSHWTDADLALAQGWAAMAFECGERNQMLKQLHEQRVSRERLDAIVPMVVHDLRDHATPHGPHIRIFDPAT